MSRFDKILAKGTIVTRWLGLADAKPFLEYIEEWREHAQKTLSTHTAPHELHRAQGELVVLNRILEMRTAITDYQRGIATGKRKPIETQPGKIQ